MLYSALRPLLFRLDPERAHGLSLAALRLGGAVGPIRALLRSIYGAGPARPRRLFDVEFKNPIGLAAGYDKDGLGWRGLALLGFGHVEVGTVTPKPQPGNPRPRLFRLAEDRSLINRLGFPSRGADFVAGRLGEAIASEAVIGVNIGKQKATPLERAEGDYEMLIRRFAGLARYLVVNVSSPNTPGLRELQSATWLRSLSSALVSCRDRQADELSRRVPVLIKLAPDMSDDDLRLAVETIAEAGLDGIVATNTTLARPALSSPSGSEAGGLSGAALTERSTACVARIRQTVGPDFPLIACGGVMSPRDAREKLEAGADLVQVYTGLVYAGPAFPRELVEALADL